MCARLNELRRERCRPLCSPSQEKFWDEESWNFVAMSRNCQRHFWDLFRLIPLATSDPTKWKATLAFLKDCPQKPDKPGHAERCNIDLNTRPSSRSPSPMSQTLTGPKRFKANVDVGASGSAALHKLSLGSPLRSQPGSQDVALPPADSEEFADWVRARIEVDTTDLAIKSLEIGRERRFARGLKPSVALSQLPSLSAMSVTYQQVYKIYLRKFSRLLANVKMSTKEGRALSQLCLTLNVDVGAKDFDCLPELLSRLRALDMVNAPP